MDTKKIQENVIRAEGFAQGLAQGFKDGYIACAKHIIEDEETQKKNELAQRQE